MLKTTYNDLLKTNLEQYRKIEASKGRRNQKVFFKIIVKIFQGVVVGDIFRQPTYFIRNKTD